MASGGAGELLGYMASRRAQIEQKSQTFESAPTASSADASHFDGIELGKAPAAADWMRTRVTDIPEEDLTHDALDMVLKARGQRPAHAPELPDIDRITAMADNLMKLQRQKLAELGALESEREALKHNEAKVAALEEKLRLEKEQHEQRKEELKNYPHPAWLEKYDGTLNVAITGNSGVGKSLLINCIRRLKPATPLWAPVGVQETTMAPTMYSFPGKDKFRLWDLPGAGTERFPRETYLRDMGLRYFDSVLIVSAGRFTTTEIELRAELERHGVPFLLVRTKVDIDVYNNLQDNRLTEEDTLKSIRKDLEETHSVDCPYLISSRDPDKYDMPLLLKEAFPGLKRAMDANAAVFDPSSAGGWGDAWSLPSSSSAILSGIQGQWVDSHDGCVYIVDGSEVHVTLPDGKAATLTLSEDDRGVWWNNRWSINMSSVSKARESAELRWAPVDLTNKPLVWRFSG